MLQARRSRLRSIRGHQVAATRLVDKERNAAVERKPKARDADPHVPVHCQGLGDILGQFRQDLEVLGWQIGVSQGSDIGQSIVQGFVVGEAGEEDEVDEGSGEEQDGAEDKG